MMLRTLMFVMALAVFSPAPSYAVEPDEVLRDPALEARARELGKGLRCVVCQNQAIDESNAELARDMRVLVRDRIGMVTLCCWTRRLKPRPWCCGSAPALLPCLVCLPWWCFTGAIKAMMIKRRLPLILKQPL